MNRRTVFNGMFMRLKSCIPLSAILAILGGCASAKLGDKAREASLKNFQSIPGSVSLYVCRENAFTGGGVGVEAFVNGRSVGALKPNTFAHADLVPGTASVFLRRNGIGVHSGDSGKLTIETKAGDVVFIWAGPAGSVIAPLTVDRFPSRAEGEACVKEAAYAIP